MTAEAVQVDFDGSRVRARARIPGVAPAAVIAAFTNPDLVRRWWGGAELRTTARLGGAYSVHFPGLGQTMSGTVLDHRASSLIAFTWHWDHLPDIDAREVWVRATAAPDGSDLDLTHRGYGTAAADLRDAEDHRAGWAHFLPGLVTLLAG